MSGIFGVVSSSVDCKRLESVLLDFFDFSRGKYYKISTSSRAILGLQGHKENVLSLIDEDDCITAFISNNTSKDQVFKICESISTKRDSKIINELRKVKGVFNLAHFERKRGVLWLLTDPLSIAKTYFVYDGFTILFSSSLRQIVNILHSKLKAMQYDLKIFPEMFYYYLVHGSLPLGKTLFQKIYKTNGGIMRYNTKSNNLTYKRISLWNFLDKNYLSSITESSFAIDLIYSTLTDAIKNEYISKETAILLSGGLDSPLISGILATNFPSKSIRAITTYYEGTEDELFKAIEIAENLGFSLKKIKIPTDPNLLLQILREAITYLDEPTSNTGYIARFLAFKEASTQQAIYLGDGADELFLGYKPITWTWDENWQAKLFASAPIAIKKQILTLAFYFNRLLKIDSLKTRALVSELLTSFRAIQQLLIYVNPSVKEFSHFILRSYNFILNCYDPILNEANMIEKVDPLNSKSYVMLHLLLESDISVDENFASRFGLRLCLPYLDIDCIRLAFNLNSKLKLKGNVTKAINREIAIRKKLIPYPIIVDLTKRGMTHPIIKLINSSIFQIEIKDELNTMSFNYKALKLIKNLQDKYRKYPRIQETLIPLIYWFSSIFKDN